MSRVIEENNRRNDLLMAPYDPVLGIGCYGERIPLKVYDYHEETIYIPKEMEWLESVQLLLKYKSVYKIIRHHLKHDDLDGSLGDYFWLAFCEQRYKYDFEFYTYMCDTILDKETGQEIRFSLNRPQREILLPELEVQRKSEQQILIQILKARQMGFSTMVQMYMKWIQCVHRTNWNSVVCSDDLTSAVNIRSMYDLSVSKMAPINGVKMSIAPFAGTKNIKVIPERGCRITVGTAQRPETVRSQDVKMAHFSEVAFYPHTEQNNPSLLESSIISAIPNVPYTMIVRESTANGVGDYFFEQWERAKRGLSGYTAVFAPWYYMDIYKVELNGKYHVEGSSDMAIGNIDDFYNSLNDYERRLFEDNEKCTLEHLNWRRWKLNTMSDSSKMTQEFPSNDIEAFIDSGSPVFIASHVEALRSDCIDPIAVGDVVGDGDVSQATLNPGERKHVLNNLKFITDEEATTAVQSGDEIQYLKKGIDKLQIWEYPDNSVQVSNRYVVSFDPQKGITDDADYGVIKVFDRYWMTEGEGPTVVALFFGHTDKDITIWKAVQIAKYYNNAELVIESNTYDSDIRDDDTEFIFDVIADYYDKLYSRTPADKIKEGAPIKYGFHTNRNTKPMVINHYKAMLRERAYTERDKYTLNEARVYEVNDGVMGAKAGKHDDRLMCTAIGLYVCYELDSPRVIEKSKKSSDKRRTVW